MWTSYEQYNTSNQYWPSYPHIVEYNFIYGFLCYQAELELEIQNILELSIYFVIYICWREEQYIMYEIFVS